jgi:hypothetical protein
MFKAHLQASASMLLLLLSTPVYAAPQPTYSCPNAEEARSEFSLAMEKYADGQWFEALPHLQKAAKLCAAPKNPIRPVTPIPLSSIEFSYIPFYFLGSCHLNMKQPPDALRNLHLSICFGEPKKDKDATNDIGTLTNQTLQQIVKQHRPDKQPPYFSEGVTAAKQDKKWERSAERMWDSMQVWPEDGETVIVAGRWPEPYVPRFHLANALYELGCQKQACEQLAQSKLKELAAKDTAAKDKYDDERKVMEQLEAKCAGARTSGQENLWICQQWQCWLKYDRR